MAKHNHSLRTDCVYASKDSHHARYLQAERTLNSTISGAMHTLKGKQK
jgi:hypothetical protein